ncbi:MAG: phage tail protein [Rhodobacterales bacterium]
MPLHRSSQRPFWPICRTAPPYPQHTRAAEADMTGRMRLRFAQNDPDYMISAEEAVLPDDATHAVAASELPLLLSRSEARQIAERWLTEARLSRDSLRLALPPSRLDLGAGDLLVLQNDPGGAQYRIDRVDLGHAQMIEATRVDPAIHLPAGIEDDAVPMRPFIAPMPVFALFMDLPLMTGDEQPHAPHLAVTADPWPGAAALYSAATGTGFTLNTVTQRRSIIGITQDPLSAGKSGLLDKAGSVTVKLTSGALSSVDLPTLLAGGNLAALGDGTADRWELFQFAAATLIAPDTYRLELLLRGQLGSDAVMPAVWPAGSYFVLLDGTPAQIALPIAARGLTQFYRIGPAMRALDDPSFTALEQGFDGIGLKPYAPVHLRASRAADQSVALSWVRRGRIDADGWEAPDIPLGEESERYALSIWQGSTLRRQMQLDSPAWVYAADDQMADGVAGAFRVEVAQISARVGPGYRATLLVGA